jgi:hypothetical protein
VDRQKVREDRQKTDTNPIQELIEMTKKTALLLEKLLEENKLSRQESILSRQESILSRQESRCDSMLNRILLLQILHHLKPKPSQPHNQPSRQLNIKQLQSQFDLQIPSSQLPSQSVNQSLTKSSS